MGSVPATWQAQICYEWNTHSCPTPVNLLPKNMAFDGTWNKKHSNLMVLLIFSLIGKSMMTCFIKNFGLGCYHIDVSGRHYYHRIFSITFDDVCFFYLYNQRIQIAQWYFKRREFLHIKQWGFSHILRYDLALGVWRWLATNSTF